MKGFRSTLKEVGYDPEEVYFHHENQRLIEKMREKVAQEGPPKDNVIPITRNSANNSKTQYKKTG